MARSNLVTNTGHRFISKGKTAFKLHIHTPDDTILHRSVGFVRLGEEEALKKAIKLRNDLGAELWGKHWSKVLKDPYLMTRLPHNLEPKIIYKARKKNAEGDNREPYYIAKWIEYTEEGEHKYRSKLCSIKKHGKLAAYSMTKRALLEAHKDNIPILLFMGRLNSIDLK
ncbi:Fe3+-citrate ABC transporter substrate-binding protein [Vibrio sp. HN007]|uniref:Fe3+-citrate ABC transporter substrate-binding protein n=1 Tax=Vibrio iocasae TaxID=3098914 RepID=UPI0035D51582